MRSAEYVENDVDTAAFNRKIFNALKPGGIYLVIDHKAEDGSGWRDAATIPAASKLRATRQLPPRFALLRVIITSQLRALQVHDCRFAIEVP